MNQALRVSPLSLASCLSSWIGISALLIAPAMAQVNGSGPSPSSDFDIVLNLPDDQSRFSEDIGGVAGETVQVNILSSGRVSSPFAGFGSEVNVDGGTLELPFSAENGSEVNISDGRVGFSRDGLFEVHTGSEVSVSGGEINGDVFALSGSLVNISGGEVEGSFDAFSGSLVNISGGSFGSTFGFDSRSFNAFSGSEVNISGGIFSDGFDANFGSVVTISGGIFGGSFLASHGSDVELLGGEFRLNGVDFTDSSITLADDDIFTGTLADGSPFVFFESDGDTLAEVTLTVASLPPTDLDPIFVNDSSIGVPTHLRAGQTLTLLAGGSLLDNFAVIDATLNVAAGTLGSGAEVLGSLVNISGGSVGHSFDAHSGTEVNITGGTVGSSFDAFSGSLVNISGGSVGSRFDAHSDSEVNISGGIVGDDFQAQSASAVNITGGAFGNGFSADSGSDVELVGGEFRLNGADFTGGTISLADDDVFTGTFADGSSFIFSNNSDRLDNVILTAASLPAVDLSPTVIDTPVVSGPFGLRAGQAMTVATGGSLRAGFAVVDATLNVEAGGVVGSSLEASKSVVNISGGNIGTDFSVFDSVVNISGGEMGSNFEAFGSEVNISGGTGANSFNADSGSEVNISGGHVGGESSFSRFYALSGSVVNISGGTLGGGPNSGFDAFSDSVVNINGGTVAGDFDAKFGSEVIITGGSVGGNFRASAFSVVNIVGTDFVLDGASLDESLTINTPFTILDRDVTLSGLLADGSPFSFYLDTNSHGFIEDRFDPDATLTVTLVSAVLLGDCDLDGDVDFLDINPFIAVLATDSFLEQADTNQDGEVSFLDIAPFIEILAGG